MESFNYNLLRFNIKKIKKTIRIQRINNVYNRGQFIKNNDWYLAEEMQFDSFDPIVYVTCKIFLFQIEGHALVISNFKFENTKKKLCSFLFRIVRIVQGDCHQLFI